MCTIQYTFTGPFSGPTHANDRGDGDKCGVAARAGWVPLSREGGREGVLRALDDLLRLLRVRQRRWFKRVG